MSIPSSHKGDMVLLLRAYDGFTKRSYEAERASPSNKSLDGPEQENQPRNRLKKYMAFVNGPHGASHAGFAYFDTLFLIAGTTGVTFAISVLLDIAYRDASAVDGQTSSSSQGDSSMDGSQFCVDELDLGRTTDDRS